LVIQIAAGIVLAVIIIRFWRQSLALTVVALVIALLAVVGWWLEGTALGSKMLVFDSLWRSSLSSVWSWLTGTFWGLTALVLLLSVGPMGVGIYFNKTKTAPKESSAARNGD